MLVGAMCVAGCSERGESSADAGRHVDAGAADGGADAGAADAGEDPCACTVGSHNELVYLMSQEGELWSWDPVTHAFAFVVGPVCDGMRPFSMAVDAKGIAWIQMVDSLGVLTLDVNAPGACSMSPYTRRDPSISYFGMSFAANSETDTCADLYVHTYSGEGPFSEGPDSGQLAAIDPVTGALRVITTVDYDGGELTGTGDGRLFALAGAVPVKLVEYAKVTGAVIETIPLEGFRRTGASAAAFHSGDIYVFIEADPPECTECLDTTCPTEHAACLADPVCAEHLECAKDMADIRDDCGGGMPAEMMTCISTCSEQCLIPYRARVSRVLRFDLDESEAPGRTTTEVIPRAPIRIVGAATSPCVSTIPF